MNGKGTGNGHLPPPAVPVPADANGTTTRPTSSDSGDTDQDFDFDTDPRHHARNAPVPFDPSLQPNGSRSLSSIGAQAFWLGFTLALCLFSTPWLVMNAYAIWRLPAFFACLSLFHFLEYYTTARWNVPTARASSFLLFSNGRAYNMAHTLATVEIIFSNFLPTYRQKLVHPYTIAAGLVLVFFGQVVRSIAMAQAGTNFNHTPVQTRKEDHVLVTHGVYGYLRHPSYFGFFWWALGTQMLVGNKVCFVGYSVALWKFFRDRIIGKITTCYRTPYPYSCANAMIQLKSAPSSLSSAKTTKTSRSGHQQVYRSSGSKHNAHLRIAFSQQLHTPPDSSSTHPHSNPSQSHAAPDAHLPCTRR